MFARGKGQPEYAIGSRFELFKQNLSFVSLFSESLDLPAKAGVIVRIEVYVSCFGFRRGWIYVRDSATARHEGNYNDVRSSHFASIQKNISDMRSAMRPKSNGALPRCEPILMRQRSLWREGIDQ
jgi:hypothetical protein